MSSYVEASQNYLSASTAQMSQKIPKYYPQIRLAVLQLATAVFSASGRLP